MTNSLDTIESVRIDRRNGRPRRQAGSDRRTASGTVTAERRTTDRRSNQRRRQIDPTTCERDYTNDEIEFMQALDAYKRTSGRMFPTCSEVLEVLRGLGYVRIQENGDLRPAEISGTPTAAEQDEDWED